MKSKINSNPFEVDSKRQQNHQVKSRHSGRWFEIDSFSKHSGRQDNNSSQPGADDKIINLWLLVVIFGIFVLLGRTAYLQMVVGDKYRDIAEGNRIRILDIKSSRGVIYDRNLNLMAENIPNFSIALVPADLPKVEEKISELAVEISKISEKSVEEVKEIIKQQSPYSYQAVVIKDNLNHNQAILTKILSGNFSGVVLKINSVRHYLNSDLNQSISHVLGYQGKINPDQLDDYLSKGYIFDDYLGKTGLELYYEKTLRGEYGKQQVEVDARGETKEILAFQKPLSGSNLLLTIDSQLQQKVEESLKKILSKYNKNRGVVIVMDPNSGEILAMVSLPSFDNNLFSRGVTQDDFSKLINDSDQPMFMRAISGEYPSGSTFKMIVGAAALQEGIINENTGVNSTGGIRVSSWFFPDWKAGGHGWTNIYKALAESVNTFFYLIGGGHEDYKNFGYLGIEKMKEYAEKFGLNKPLGVDLPSEAAGFFPSIEWKNETKGEKWYIGDTYHASIGQGDILVTPLQVAAYTSVFANGGALYRPYVVKSVLDSENNVISETEPKILSKDFISLANINIIKRGLRQGVTSGSSRGLLGLPIAVAAKTGTAEWSSTKPPHAWMTAFAPYENPQIVVTVLIEEGEEGSRVALPVVSEIIKWWAENR